MTSDKDALLRALWRDKMHVEPRALDLAPPAVRRSYEHVFQPVEIVLADLRAFPAGLLRLWRDTPRGHAVFTHEASRYAPGPQPWRDGALESVAYVSIVALRQDPATAWTSLLALVDHLLGGECDAARPRFSEGAGITPALEDASRRYQEIVRLGYAAEGARPEDAASYFARTLWLYLHDAQRLNVLDPLSYRLYHGTLLAESFWAGQRSSLG